MENTEKHGENLREPPCSPCLCGKSFSMNLRTLCDSVVKITDVFSVQLRALCVSVVSIIL